MNSISIVAQEEGAIWNWMSRPMNLGQTEKKFTRVKKFGRPIYYVDKIDDTKNYKLLVDNIYKDTANRIYIKSCYSSILPKIHEENDDSTGLIKGLSSDSLIKVEYYKDFTNFFDLKTYKKINGKYFINKGKVYLWWFNSDGDYPILVNGADPKSFIPFKKIAGGIDKNHVFFWGTLTDFDNVYVANSKKVKVLYPRSGCWNCNIYFHDDEHVYYGTKIIEPADPRTFKLVNSERIDAQDRNYEYFEGKIINEK